MSTDQAASLAGDPGGRVPGPPSNRRVRRVQRDLHLRFANGRLAEGWGTVEPPRALGMIRVHWARGHNVVVVPTDRDDLGRSAAGSKPVPRWCDPTRSSRWNRWRWSTPRR
jgi:hypothetical protein